MKTTFTLFSTNLSRNKNRRLLNLQSLENRLVCSTVMPGPIPLADAPAADDTEPALAGTGGHGNGCSCGGCRKLVDASGNTSYALPLGPRPASDFFVGPVAAGAAPFPLGDTFALHSRPGATKVIYLDFDGHSTIGTDWNFAYGSVETPAYNFEGGAGTFSPNERERIQAIWERVAEDFSPFDVDVTTEDPGVEALRRSGPGDTRWGKRVCIGGRWEDWLNWSAGGVAYLDSFRWSVETPCYVFADTLFNGEKNIVEAISHEVGHTFGLSHDGTFVDEYYEGQDGPGTPGWAPIMGVGYYLPVTQWSRGEYPNANNPQDDLAIITSAANGVGYRPDDAGNTIASATPAVISENSLSFAGVIERPTDFDVLGFSTGIGSVSFNFDPYLRDPNLDIFAELLDDGGNVLASDNRTSDGIASMAASIVNYSITVPGTYYLRVSGVGAGSPSTGYSDYGSIGQYWVSGTIVDKPVLLNLEDSPVEYVEDGATVAVTASLGLSSAAQPTGATVALAGFQPGDRLTFTPRGAIVGGYDAGTGTLTLTGNDTLARYQEVLRSVRFDNPLADPVAGVRTAGFQFSDANGNVSPLVTRALTVVPVNDQPTLDTPDPASLGEDSGLRTITLNGLGTGGETQTLFVTATSDNPALIPDPIGEVVGTTGSLRLAPVADAFGTATITVTVRDDGGTARGGSDTITRQFLVTVNGINDPPMFDLPADAYFIKNPGPVSLPGFAGAIAAGPPNESAQSVSFETTADQPGLFLSAPAIAPDGTLTFTPADDLIGTATVTVRARDDGGTIAGGIDTSATKTFLLNIGVNRAPVLDAARLSDTEYVARDSQSPPVRTAASLINAGFSDPDIGTPVGGIAIVGVGGANGQWLFSIDDGKTWASLLPASPASARLLGPADLVKFVPAKGETGAGASLTYRAWDQFTGTRGSVADLTADSAIGMNTAYSVAVGTTRYRIAPMISVLPEDSRTAGRALTPWAGVTIADADGPKAGKGVAVIGFGGTATGRWEYRTPAGWKPLPGLTPARATLLRSTDQLRFVPDANQFGEAYLLYRAWDQSSGASGATVDLSSPASVGGNTPFSVGTDAFFFRVTPVNDRPALDPGVVKKPAVFRPEEFDPLGESVASILGAGATDADPGTAPGIAITLAGRKGGLWQYRLAAGGDWRDIPLVSAASALLLGPDDRVRFAPGAGSVVTSLSYKAWDRASGSAGALANTNRGDSFSAAVVTATPGMIAGATLNKAPTLSAPTMILPSIAEDSRPVARKVSLLLDGNYADADASTARGIALTGLTGARDGRWQYSLNGVTWRAVPDVSVERALLLRDTDQIRFLPNLNFNGNVSVTYRAWDRTRGSAGSLAHLGLAGNTGGSSPFGLSSSVAQMTITPVNDRPVLNTIPAPTLHSVKPGESDPTGDPVSLLLGTALSDVDPASSRGIAIVKAATTHGTWQYQLNGATDWTPVPAVSTSKALLLREQDKIRFAPKPGFEGLETISYAGWDQTAGTPGTLASVTPILNSLSVKIETAGIKVTPLNTRPVLNLVPGMQLPPMARNNFNSAGVLVSSMVNGSVMDGDRGTTPGIAIVGTDNRNGEWEYSTDGVRWFNLGKLSPASALVLAPDSRIRFLPKLDYVGSATIRFRAWDRSDFLSAPADANSAGDSFSLAIQTASMAVNAAPTLSVP